MRCSISNVSAAKAFQTVFYLHHKTYWPRNLSTQSSVEDTLKMRCQFLFQTAWNFTPFRAHVVTSSRLRPRPKVGLFMRRTKRSEFTSGQVRRLWLSSSSGWVWIKKRVSFVRFRWIQRVKIVLGTKVWSSHETSSINKLKICVIMYDKLYDNVILPSL